MFSPDNIRRSFLSRFAAALLAICVFTAIPVLAQSKATPKSAGKVPASSGRGMAQADVERLWKLKDDTLLMNQMRLKGLAFEPEEDWLMIDLPKATGVAPADVPNSAAYLKGKIPPAPELDAVSAAAPGLLTEAKEAAQKRDVKLLDAILHPELAKDKSKIYVLFDTANYRGHTLGQYASERNRQVSVQFFELTSSQVESVNYVYFATSHGKIVLRDAQSGPEQAERFLKDEEKVAQSKLQLMFRALNDGDESGVKKICTDGLYDSIKEWGGATHPGDRLTRGHKLEQVTVTTSVPLDQKSVRVVARISYPLNDKTKIEFDADFERIGNDLKIVRVRDALNKIIVYDPDMDNYLNRRYKLPDAPVPDPKTLAMTEQIPFLSVSQLNEMAIRALQDHDKDRIIQMAGTLAESDPTSGVGQGYRAGANLLLGKYDDAEKDASFALQHGGTVYFAVEHHLGNMGTENFDQVVVGISATKIQYIPVSGKGSPQEMDISTAKANFEKDKIPGAKVINATRPPRPFLDIADGRNKHYNLAALGTTCIGGTPQGGAKLVQTKGFDACGMVPMKDGKKIGPVQMPPSPDWEKGPPVFVSANWQRELTVVLRAIQEAQHGSGQ
jgi:hypothetical protein